MSNKKINIMIAIAKKSEEALLREHLENIKDFSLCYLPFGYQLSDMDYDGLDIVISCNATLERNLAFDVKNLKSKKHKIFTYAALYRRQLHRSSKNLARVNGCILLDGNLKWIGNAMRLAIGGYSVFPSKLDEIIIDFSREEMWIHDLQLNECLILNEMAKGSNDKEIAHKLKLGSGSIKNEKSALIEKLKVTKPAELKYFALRHKDALHDRRRSFIRQLKTASHVETPQRQRSGK